MRIQIRASAEFHVQFPFTKLISGNFSSSRRVGGKSYKTSMSSAGANSVLGFVHNFAVKHVVPRYRNVVMTWNDKPDVSEENVLEPFVDGEWTVLNVYPRVGDGEVDKFAKLNEGFMRTTRMSRGFKPKTTPRKLRSYPGRGGPIFGAPLEPPAPVVPREFIDVIYEEIEPLFMRMAYMNFQRLLDQSDTRRYRRQSWGGLSANLPLGRRAKRRGKGGSERDVRLTEGAATRKHNYPSKRKSRGGPTATDGRRWERLDE